MNETVMKNAFESLNDKQIDFICGEFEIGKTFIESMNEDELNSVYEDLCDIEVDEICAAGDSKLSERGEIVSSIVTTVGNELASKFEYLDEEEFEDELKEKAETEKTPHKCPICGKTEFPETGSFDICTECGWEDDMIQTEEPDEEAGANMMSLNEYKTAYESGWRPEWLSEVKKKLKNT
ncbi:MAG: hypothetical protein NC452_02130 [Eubacterium sp.]|nr:hypothetical protein [Eubacterium sp.]